MKLSSVKARALEAPTMAGLEADINAFLASGNQRTFVDVKIVGGAAGWGAVILYTE